MSIEKAGRIFKTFHKKDPDRIIRVGVKIPSIMYEIGYGVQISYRSNKWMDDGSYNDYIHWLEHPTIILSSMNFGKKGGKEIQIKQPSEITFLGYAICFNYSKKDKTYIKMNNVEYDEKDPSEQKRLNGSSVISFDCDPETSHDYVACDSSGKIVYILSESHMASFMFINDHLKITSHGIEG